MNSAFRRCLVDTLALCWAASWSALLSGALIWGGAQALTYVYELIAAAIGATGQTASAASVLQILVTLVIATPIVWWSVTEWTRSNVARRSLREPRPADTLEAQ